MKKRKLQTTKLHIRRRKSKDLETEVGAPIKRGFGTSLLRLPRGTGKNIGVISCVKVLDLYCELCSAKNAMQTGISKWAEAAQPHIGNITMRSDTINYSTQKNKSKPTTPKQ